MRTHREASSMAKTLRACLAENNVHVSHGECLEIVARQFGFSVDPFGNGLRCWENNPPGVAWEK
ncbi:MAG TPA: glyoxalase superfamily protein [Gammaproteobacteria bacterium]|nr:glyoxalase superfamily protein [Gammaproteobacteria bacterium]